MSYIGQRPVVGRYIKLDQISSGFNGSETSFSMTAGSQAVFPGTARNLLLSLGGVIQEPDTNFTISGSTLTFTTAPVANTTFFAVIFGDMQSTGTPSDGTVLPASIASSGNFSFPEVTVTGDVNIADSIIHSGDSDTKIRFPANDIITMERGGAEVFRVDSSGLKIPNKLMHTGDPDTFLEFGTDAISLDTGGVERLSLGTTTVFNETGADVDFRIEGDTDANLVNVDAGNDLVNIGSTTNFAKFGVFKTVASDATINSANAHIGIGSGSGSGTICQSILYFAPLNGSGNRSPAAITAIASGNTASDLAFFVNANNNFGQTPSIQAMRIASSGNLQLPNDTVFLQIGAGQDLDLHHNGTNSYIRNKTGDLHIRPLVAEEGIILKPNGAVELYCDNSKKLETTSIGITLFGDLKIPDNEELRLGDGNDLQIYHNGSNSYIDSNTGNLYFRGSNGQMLFRPNNNEDALVLKPNGAVELYYDNSKKFETTSTGADVTGRLTTDGVFIGDGGNNDTSLSIGANNDLRLYHDGSNSHILDRGTGSLLIKSDVVNLGSESGEYYFRGFENGAAFLRYDNSTKLETFASGAKWTGQFQGPVAGDSIQWTGSSSNAFLLAMSDGSDLPANSSTGFNFHHWNGSAWKRTHHFGRDQLYMPDNVKLLLGTSNDLQIFHDGSNSHITSGTGQFFLSSSNSNIWLRGNEGGMLDTAGNEYLIRATSNGSVKLFYDNSQKFETTSTGVRVNSTGSSHGLFVHHSNGNEVARLAHGGSGDEGVLVLKDSGNTTVILAGENGQNGYIAGPANFFFGTTSSPSSSQRGVKISSTTTGNPILLATSSAHYTGGGYTHYRIIDDHGVVGNVNADGDGTASYNSASDYRLKENVVPITDGITKLKTLKPYRFNFKTADVSKVVQGFFAHEVSEAVPNAVKGVKDEMKSLYYEEGDTIPEGKAVGDFKEYSTTEINPQSLDHAKMVPLLTAALQEAIGKIETLETRVAALEAA